MFEYHTTVEGIAVALFQVLKVYGTIYDSQLETLEKFISKYGTFRVAQLDP
jgi:hypothetical protein